ncbi:methyltransferase, FkbM family [Friedmanniella luteola]|uniref:Methyltransferase, FkbM family n=1 Tax=Friedmanniella luteola TaxID=546871 RepID=A0A1H1XHW6_9ACTN|nr:50S ribosomal protein L11 methyltransferase [Friedmanniella luteola]SDT08827.1 methyltransferase, FkbM family [Friedmanniella luteola]
MSDEPGFWSSTDFPYTCLRDRHRTATLAEVVTATVRPGDVVLDAGAGTGILALYAARAGASRVFAVENDPVLCRHLRSTVERNGYAGVIEVVEADVHTFTAPTVDVALMELVETALVDEALVSAYNALLGLGTVGPATRSLPAGYTTAVQPVVTENAYDGFEVVALRHDWSFYEGQPEVWGHWPWSPAGPVTPVWTGAFAGEPVEPRVDVVVAVDDPDPRVNGLRVTGELEMPDGRVCGEFASLNGPKVLPLPVRPAGSRALRLGYTMAEGLAGLEVAWV